MELNRLKSFRHHWFPLVVWMYSTRIVDAGTVGEAAAEIRSVDVSEDCVRIMRDKAVFRLVKLCGVRNAVANILKQEMLSCGGDATVSQWTVNCSKPKTDVLLMGTLKHYRIIIAKMRQQGAHLKSAATKGEYKALSEELSEILKADLKKPLL
jgi:hypothetical protein